MQALCHWLLSTVERHAAKAVHSSIVFLIADSLAVGGSGVSCTAGLAAKYLGEAAHMTGTGKACT